MSALMLVFIVGIALCIGSFTNVLIDRLPKQLASANEFGEFWDTNEWGYVLGGTSRCSSCSTDVRPQDNIPLVSFFVLRGRCRSCDEPIPRFHPFVELAVPAVMVAIGFADGWTWKSLPLLVAVPFLVAVAVIDQRTMMVPTRLVWPGLAAVAVGTVVAAGLTGEWTWLRTAVLGATLLAAPLAILWFLLPRAMGFGDVRLATLVGWVAGLAIAPGVWLGSLAASLLVLAIASLIGLVMGVVVAGAHGLRARVPFGPALVLAGFVGVLFAQQIREGLRL